MLKLYFVFLFFKCGKGKKTPTSSSVKLGPPRSCAVDHSKPSTPPVPTQLNGLTLGRLPLCCHGCTSISRLAVDCFDIKEAALSVCLFKMAATFSVQECFVWRPKWQRRGSSGNLAARQSGLRRVDRSPFVAQASFGAFFVLFCFVSLSLSHRPRRRFKTKDFSLYLLSHLLF